MEIITRILADTILITLILWLLFRRTNKDYLVFWGLFKPGQPSPIQVGHFTITTNKTGDDLVDECVDKARNICESYDKIILYSINKI